MTDNQKILSLFVLVYLLIVLVTNAYLFIRIRQYASTLEITAKATGELEFCINFEPFLVNGCPNSTLQNQLYTCQVNATNIDNDTLSYSSFFITSPELFNISSSGVISFTPNQSDVGNHSYTIIVFDNSSCANNYDSATYTIEVIDVKIIATTTL